VYEGGVRVPFAAQWKGRVPAGAVCERPAMSIDVFPTILAAAGIEPPAGVTFDGINLMTYMDEKSGGATAPRNIFWRFGPQWAVREGDMKLVHSSAEGIQLFDLAKDVGESKNLVSEQPETVKRLRATYDQWNAQNEEPRWRDTRDVKRAARRGGTPATAPAGDD
ncbi:MAG: sulfatase/phosphatase domain-containing protein, partial [Tepidisphaeraceae bacterium]